MNIHQIIDVIQKENPSKIKSKIQGVLETLKEHKKMLKLFPTQVTYDMLTNYYRKRIFEHIKMDLNIQQHLMNKVLTSFREIMRSHSKLYPKQFKRKINA